MITSEEVNSLSAVTLHGTDGVCRATFVPAKGGVCSSLCLPGVTGEGRELLFTHPHLWDLSSVETPGGWPFLFPVCGRLERNGERGVYLYQGRLRSLPLHGFAMHRPWEVSMRGERLELILRADEETRKAYPFEFEVVLSYYFEGGAFVCEQCYTNRGLEPMPFYAGFHPYFLTPPPGAGKEKTRVDFRPLERFVYNERLTDVVAVGEAPALPKAINEPHLNELLARLGPDKEVRLLLPDGLTVHMSTQSSSLPDLFPFLQLYTLEDKPFFCLEPWMAPPNTLNAVAGVRWVGAGETLEGRIVVWTSVRDLEA